MVLLAHVRAAFRRSRESYGAERVHHELAENGIEVGRHRVARLMRGDGLSPKRKQKFKKTTDSQHNKAVASNLLDQNFSAEAPNEKWAADISYIWTAQGWLYLAVPQTQGKIERWHQTLKNRVLLENDYLPGDLEAGVGAFVAQYNHRRYHESLGNLTPG